jgi:hypothetical protein
VTPRRPIHGCSAALHCSPGSNHGNRPADYRIRHGKRQLITLARQRRNGVARAEARLVVSRRRSQNGIWNARLAQGTYGVEERACYG